MRNFIVVLIPENVLVRFLAGNNKMQPLVPEDAKITGFAFNFARSMFELRIEHPSFAPVKENEQPPVYNLQAPSELDPKARLTIA
jgi:hypothetical protein